MSLRQLCFSSLFNSNVTIILALSYDKDFYSNYSTLSLSILTRLLTSSTCPLHVLCNVISFLFPLFLPRLISSLARFVFSYCFLSSTTTTVHVTYHNRKDECHMTHKPNHKQWKYSQHLDECKQMNSMHSNSPEPNKIWLILHRHE